MTVERVKAIFVELTKDARAQGFRGRLRLVLDDETALAGRTSSKDVHRARASAEVDDSGMGTIYIAEALLSDPSARQRGVLSHELGHVFLLQHGVEEHTEREADAAAEELFGKQINYDADDIQTTGRGVHPRPKRLDARSNPGSAVGGCCVANPARKLTFLDAVEAMRHGVFTAQTREEAKNRLAEMLNADFQRFLPLFEAGGMIDERKLDRLARRCADFNRSATR